MITGREQYQSCTPARIGSLGFSKATSDKCYSEELTISRKELAKITTKACGDV